MAGTMIFFHRLTKEQLERVKKSAPQWQVIYAEEDEWRPHVYEAEVWVGWNKQAAEIALGQERKSPLRWIQSWGAGVNSFPLEQLKERGIYLTSASGVHGYPISETIFAMMLAFVRRLPLYIKNQKRMIWDSGGGALSELHHKTIGLLGTGAIGQETAKIAKAFGMKVLGMRRSGKPASHVDQMYDYEGLERLLRESDVVVNSLPLTDETRHMMNRERFAQMKSSAIYINVGRGATTDTEALVEALMQGKIAGAGLDVFEQEPLPPEHPLWRMDNVIITPHTSGSTVYYNDRVLDIFLDNLTSYMQGKAPHRNLVDYEKQY